MAAPGESKSGLPVDILSTAEATTVTLELKALYAATNNIAYWKAAERVSVSSSFSPLTEELMLFC